MVRLSNRVFKSKEAQKAVAAGAIEWQFWANSLGVLAGFGKCCFPFVINFIHIYDFFF